MYSKGCSTSEVSELGRDNMGGKVHGRHTASAEQLDVVAVSG